ncbi:carbohydrate kinase family protein [Shumkonia mesophila]|uniref:carbohydrate kinase family protein n=1 Tax=Shumkonia mesophila TaxID=2838854 RepID=UPI002934AA2A|nr:carbohydrate kinase [Shumkonia mesophila]
MIVCAGEALIDMLPRQLPDGSDIFLPVPGGAIFNTAIALGRLGENVQFFSGLSTDMFGRRLVACLEESGAGTTLCKRVPRPTTLAFVTLADGNAHYSFYDERTAGRMLDIVDLPDLPQETAALHFGAISLIPEPCGSAYEELMRRYHGGPVISFDPNVRPGFVDDEAAYRNRLRRMAGMSDIIKVSEEDLSWLEPHRRFEQIARDWIANGAKVVVLTRGEDGARAITKTLDVGIPAVETTVVDTVGAGDSFNAGFLAGLRRQGVLSKPMLVSLSCDALTTSLKFAAQIAAFTVGQSGANPPWENQLSQRKTD